MTLIPSEESKKFGEIFRQMQAENTTLREQYNTLKELSDIQGKALAAEIEAKEKYKNELQVMIELLTKVRDEMNGCRYDPRKY